MLVGYEASCNADDSFRFMCNAQMGPADVDG